MIEKKEKEKIKERGERRVRYELKEKVKIIKEIEKVGLNNKVEFRKICNNNKVSENTVINWFRKEKKEKIMLAFNDTHLNKRVKSISVTHAMYPQLEIELKKHARQARAEGQAIGNYYYIYIYLILYCFFNINYYNRKDMVSRKSKRD